MAYPLLLTVVNDSGIGTIIPQELLLMMKAPMQSTKNETSEKTTITIQAAITIITSHVRGCSVVERLWYRKKNPSHTILL